jgi:nitrite reductase (cytochrome c-552)
MQDENRVRERELRRSRRRFVAVVVGAVLASAAVTFGVVALLMNIQQRKVEALNPFFRVVELDDTVEDPEIWGKNFPMQYDQYRKTVDMARTRFGGSEAVPQTPTEADPRTVVAQSRLAEDPRLVEMWKGYAFAVDFREERGHAYMLEDQTFTERQLVAKQPGTCIHCHGSVYLPYKKLGDGDLIAGFEKMNRMPFGEARKLVEHPVACIDCHDPATMQLRVTRPGFLEGVRLRKNDPNYDVNRQATHQEMRTFVCAQCHVEYYFKGDEKRLTYPWFNGIRGDEILAYYDEQGFHDWIHADTGAPMLKAQHPEFEMYSQGIHARSGVSCADCHMPYMRVGGLKISDHHVRSPLLNINNACQTCHNFPEEELKARAEAIQQNFFDMRDLTLEALMQFVGDIKAARAAGIAGESLAAAQQFQRKATFLIDFVEAENSTGFHAPHEAARLLVLANDYIRQGQLALRPAATPPAQVASR